MIQQQRFGGTLASTPGRIMKLKGGGVLLRGLTTASGREGIFTMGYLGIAPVCQRYLAESQGMNQYTAGFMGAVIAGVFASAVTHPMDTIKTCMQGDVEEVKYTTVSKTYKTIVSEEGHISLFKGWGWRVSRMICAMFIINECKVALAPVIFPHKMDN